MIPPGSPKTNRMSGQILEDIKALTVNAVMPSFPDDSPTHTHTHTHRQSEKCGASLIRGVFLGVVAAEWKWKMVLFRPHFFIALHYYYTASPRHRPSSFVSCSHIVAYLKSQFVWRPRCHPVAVDMWLWLCECGCRCRTLPISPPTVVLSVRSTRSDSRSPLSVTCYRLVLERN